MQKTPSIYKMETQMTYYSIVYHIVTREDMDTYIREIDRATEKGHALYNVFHLTKDWVVLTFIKNE